MRNNISRCYSAYITSHFLRFYAGDITSFHPKSNLNFGRSVKFFHNLQKLIHLNHHIIFTSVTCKNYYRNFIIWRVFLSLFNAFQILSFSCFLHSIWKGIFFNLPAVSIFCIIILFIIKDIFN